MMRKLAVLVVLLSWPAAANAQRLNPPTVSAHRTSRAIVTATSPTPAARFAAQDSARRPSGIRPMRVAKWSVLAAAAGAGIYGFLQNNEADDRFRELEQLCQEQQFRCANLTPSGAYADAEFETLYQDVRRLDRRSHLALVFSQVGVATGVALFLLDLGNGDAPGDIPWTPTSALHVRSVPGAIELSLRLPIPSF